MNVGRHSLLGLAILAAQRSELITDLCVTTDSEEIAEEARRYGVEVPWLRPANLATDEASTPDTVVDAVHRSQERSGTRFDYVAVLEPTAPLREYGDVDGAISAMVSANGIFDAIVCFVEASFHPSALHSIASQGGEALPYYSSSDGVLNRRQDGPMAFLPVGNCFVVKPSFLFTHRSFYAGRVGAYHLPKSRGVEIDDASDLVLARALFGQMEKLVGGG